MSRAFVSTAPITRPETDWADRAQTILNSAIALALLVVTLPLAAGIAVAILITSGRPIIYSGVRLGRHRRHFRMYKFRTLVRNAERVVGGRLLTPQDGLTTPLGGFLRETRLDELPQLVNVLLGQMRFIGPRPERPEVYEAQCRHLAGYDRRFAVKPGLIGYSQLFTPHATSKRLRAMLDNRVLGRRPRPFDDLSLIAYTAVIVLHSSAMRLCRYIREDLWRRHILRRYREQRALRRVRPPRPVQLVLAGMPGAPPPCARVLDINDLTLLAVLQGPQPEALAGTVPLRFHLEIEAGNNGTTRRRRATCRGSIRQVRRTSRGIGYVIAWEPASETSHFKVHQHVLRRSLAYPRSWR